MLLPLQNRRIAYDLMGPETGPVVCFTHSLASDSGMWAEQVPALAGGRVPRAARRHARPWRQRSGGGRLHHGPARRRRAAVLDALGFRQVHYIGLSIGGMLGQAFALNHGAKLKSMMLCDTMPPTPADAKAAWAPRIKVVREANSLAPLADGDDGALVHRGVQAEEAGPLEGDPRHHRRHDAARAISAVPRRSRISTSSPQLPSIKTPTLVVCGDDDPGTPPAGNKRIAELIPRRPL